MELNAEQIKKALECCKTPLASDCENCSYTGKRLEDGVYEGCVNCLVGDALSLITSQEQRIEELTEENERLRGCVKSKEEVEAIMRATYEPLVKEIAKEQIDKAVTDTVRKMQEKVEKKILSINPNLCGLLPFIDQIAKEMLEGG